MRRAAPAALLPMALAFALVGPGCNEVATTTTNVEPTPESVLRPSAPGEAGKDKGQAKPVDLTAGREADDSEGDAADVALTPVKYDEMLKQIAANTKAKYTMVDAWATWCAPCMENFPHVVEMNRKYAGQGLAVISLSLDDPTDLKAVARARSFLREKKATFTNYLLDEDQETAFNKLNVNGIPAVFVFGPDGKEIRRYTMDDPNHQFTYDQVERDVAALLKGDSSKPADGKPSTE